MIDEKKLIAEIRNAINDDRYAGYKPAAVLYEVYDMITEMPKGNWIPCSERLPEDKKAVLATVYDGTHMAVYIFYYENKIWKDIDGYGVNCADILAWQPLPEPWEGEEV